MSQSTERELNNDIGKVFDHVDSLQQQLDLATTATSESGKLMEHYKQQLSERDQEVERLRAEVTGHNNREQLALSYVDQEKKKAATLQQEVERVKSQADLSAAAATEAGKLMEHYQQQLSEAQAAGNEYITRTDEGIEHLQKLLEKAEQERDTAQARCAEKDRFLEAMKRDCLYCRGIGQYTKPFDRVHDDPVTVECEHCKQLDAVIGADGSDLLKKLAEKDEALRDANSLLRSAHSIASREGLQTNWEAFRGQLDKALKEQHAMLYPPEAALSPAVSEKGEKE